MPSQRTKLVNREPIPGGQREHRLYLIGEKIAKGDNRPMYKLMREAGYTTHDPGNVGVSHDKALEVYRRKSGALVKKGSVENAAKHAEETLINALSDPEVDFKAKLNIARWIAEFGHKKRMDIGDAGTAPVGPTERIKYRRAFMRAVLKGILLGADAERRESTAQLVGRLTERIDAYDAALGRT